MGMGEAATSEPFPHCSVPVMPAMVMIVAVVIVLVLFLVLVPEASPIFNDLNYELAVPQTWQKFAAGASEAPQDRHLGVSAIGLAAPSSDRNRSTSGSDRWNSEITSQSAEMVMPSTNTQL